MAAGRSPTLKRSSRSDTSTKSKKSTKSTPPAKPRTPATRARRAVARLLASPADVQSVLDRLETQHPNAFTELNFRNAYELLVATILSAQSTDARVNIVTPALFKRYPDAATLAKAEPQELEPQILSTGFFRMKSRSLIGMARGLVDRHGGNVPADMDALTALPGVGRKTANVVLGHALGVPGLPVDRHVLRVVNRLGFVRSDDAVVVESVLTSALPPERWTRASDTLILHGRRICRPKPLCDRCAVRSSCAYFRALGSKAAATSRAGAVPPKRLRGRTR